MKLTKENIELLDIVKGDLEKKGAIVNTLNATIKDDLVNYVIVVKWENGEIWHIDEIESN